MTFDLVTSLTYEGAQWIFSKISFLKSVHEIEKDELSHVFLVKHLTILLYEILHSSMAK